MRLYSCRCFKPANVKIQCFIPGFFLNKELADLRAEIRVCLSSPCGFCPSMVSPHWVLCVWRQQTPRPATTLEAAGFGCGRSWKLGLFSRSPNLETLNKKKVIPHMGLAFPLRERFRGVIVGAVQVVIVNSYSSEVCMQGAASEPYTTLPPFTKSNWLWHKGGSFTVKCQWTQNRVFFVTNFLIWFLWTST